MREVTTSREQSEPATTNDELSSFPAATTALGTAFRRPDPKLGRRHFGERDLRGMIEGRMARLAPRLAREHFRLQHFLRSPRS
jgi:hypothetical protein